MAAGSAGGTTIVIKSQASRMTSLAGTPLITLKEIQCFRCVNESLTVHYLCYYSVNKSYKSNET